MIVPSRSVRRRAITVLVSDRILASVMPAGEVLIARARFANLRVSTATARPRMIATVMWAGKVSIARRPFACCCARMAGRASLRTPATACRSGPTWTARFRFVSRRASTAIVRPRIPARVCRVGPGRRAPFRSATRRASTAIARPRTSANVISAGIARIAQPPSANCRARTAGRVALPTPATALRGGRARTA